MPVFEDRDNYLYVESFEPYSLKRSLTTIRQIGHYCKQKALNKVLIDIRHLRADISMMDRYEIGKEFAKSIGSKIRVAVLADTNIINYTTEHAAVNRGAKIQVFVDSQKALEWLDVNL